VPRLFLALRLSCRLEPAIWPDPHRVEESPVSAQTPTVIDCAERSVRAINRAIRAAVADGATAVRLLNPGARHNLGVALPGGVKLTIDGSAGYYAAGLNDGATVEVKGSAGWGAAESMHSGTVTIDGDAGNAVAASIRNGTVIVRGNASTRAGIAMKGGALVVAGDVGPMAAFIMQKGILVVCGNAGDGVADSMYAGTVYVGGKTGELGGDAIDADFTEADRTLVFGLLEEWQVSAPPRFRKLVAGKKLWNFQQADLHLWKAAL
jgi:glutamate synthase domain-containing protein 3